MLELGRSVIGAWRGRAIDGATLVLGRRGIGDFFVDGRFCGLFGLQRCFQGWGRIADQRDDVVDDTRARAPQRLAPGGALCIGHFFVVVLVFLQTKRMIRFDDDRVSEGLERQGKFVDAARKLEHFTNQQLFLVLKQHLMVGEFGDACAEPDQRGAVSSSTMAFSYDSVRVSRPSMLPRPASKLPTLSAISAIESSTRSMFGDVSPNENAMP